MREATAKGAHLINDVRGLCLDGALASKTILLSQKWSEVKILSVSELKKIHIFYTVRHKFKWFIVMHYSILSRNLMKIFWILVLLTFSSLACTVDANYNETTEIGENYDGLDLNHPSDTRGDKNSNGVTALGEFLTGTNTSGSLDIDGDGQYNALTDGLLLLRGMFGLDGDALIAGTVALDATYYLAIDIESRIATLGDLIDIDGNGQIDALTDGLLILRYLFGLEGDALITGVMPSDATRTTIVDIEAHLKTLLPTTVVVGAIYGTENSDTLYGTENQDTIYAGLGDDFIYALGGADLIYGEGGNDTIAGGFGGDKIYGGNGNDILSGSNNFDELYGGNGDDILDGGDGKDRLYGGNGNDVFVARPGDGSDGFLTTNVLYDFEDGVDKIRLDGGLNFSNLSITQGTAGSYIVAGRRFYYDYTNHTLIKAGSEYMFTVADTQHSAMSADDFN